VALLGGTNRQAWLAAALLFGALHKGAAALDLETERVTQELSLVLQAADYFVRVAKDSGLG